MQKTKSVFLVAAVFLVGCGSVDKKSVLETGNPEGRPDWVSSNKITWNEGDQIFIRTQYVIRGDERVNGCYQLAKLETKETVLREISEQIRGQIDSAQQSISEDAEAILNQSRSSEFKGRVIGMRNLEQYHERAKVSGTERIECFLLSSIKTQDYEKIRKEVVDKLVAVDSELKAALNRRQIDFFSANKTQGEKE